MQWGREFEDGCVCRERGGGVCGDKCVYGVKVVSIQGKKHITT